MIERRGVQLPDTGGERIVEVGVECLGDGRLYTVAREVRQSADRGGAELGELIVRAAAVRHFLG